MVPTVEKQPGIIHKYWVLTAVCLIIMSTSAIVYAQATPGEPGPKAYVKEYQDPLDANKEGYDDYELAKMHYDRAVDYHLSGMLVQAVEQYKKAIILDPEMAAYHADLGEAYRVMGNTRGAISELETAVELSPGMVNALTTLGVIYERENLPHKAIDYHRRAIKIDPRHYVAYNNLGHAYDTLGLVRAAMDNYKKAIEIKEDFSPAYDNLGTDLMRLNRPQEGISMLKKAIDYAGEGHPQLGLYYNDLGAALVMSKDYEKAYSAFEKALSLSPNNPDIQRNFIFIRDHLYGKSN